MKLYTLGEVYQLGLLKKRNHKSYSLGHLKKLFKKNQFKKVIIKNQEVYQVSEKELTNLQKIIWTTTKAITTKHSALNVSTKK